MPQGAEPRLARAQRRALHPAAWLLLSCAACGTAHHDEGEAAGTAVQRAAIVGGQVDNADPEVFMLDLHHNNGQVTVCTATLIASRTLLTAAHCLDPSSNPGSTSVDIWAMNKTSFADAGSSDLIHVIEARRHPSYTLSPLANDIGVALLERAPAGVTPKPWSSASLGGFTGRAIRVLGYGITAPGASDWKTKRVVDLSFGNVSPNRFLLGNQVDKGICNGDSGGPTFHRFSDGVERVVGVHSFTANAQCTYGGDTRVDAYASFIRGYLCPQDSVCPSPQCDFASDPDCADCGQNERCVDGCPSPDPDCAECGQNGRCSLACPAPDPDCQDCGQNGRCSAAACPSVDPDCEDCGKNSVCSLATCPSGDPDCAAAGASCSSSVQCQSRLCLVEQGYCSQPCSAPSDCPAPMYCSEAKNCVLPHQVALEVAKVQGPAAGCSSTGGPLTVVLMGASVLAAVRRRNSKRWPTLGERRGKGAHEGGFQWLGRQRRPMWAATSWSRSNDGRPSQNLLGGSMQNLTNLIQRGSTVRRCASRRAGTDHAAGSADRAPRKKITR